VALWGCFELTDTDLGVQMTSILSPEMKKKIFDKAFKEHAVNLWLGSGKSAREIADELGIKPDRLYTWKQALAPGPPGGKGAPGPDGAGLRNSKLNWRAFNGRINTCASSGIF